MIADVTSIIAPEERVTNTTNFGTFTVPAWSSKTDDAISASSVYASAQSWLMPATSMQYAFPGPETRSDSRTSRNAQTIFWVNALDSTNRPQRNQKSLQSSSTLALSDYDDKERLRDPKFYNSLKKWIKYNVRGRMYHSIGGDIESGGENLKAFSFLSVSYRSPITLPTFLALFYSYIPFVMFFFLFLYFLLSKESIFLYAVCTCTIISAINEAFIKNIFREERPPGSLVNSFGMPSTHCMVSYGILCWLVVEFAFSKPFPAFPFIFLILVFLVLLPVPWARYYLDDHTAMQCVIGCGGGVIAGLIAYFIRSLFAYPVPMVPG